MRCDMSNYPSAQVSKTDTGKIRIEIDKEDFENFCNACGLFREEFMEYLKQAEQDHQAGRVMERNSLYELIDE